MEVKVEFKDVEQIKRFVNITAKQEFDADIVCGRIVVDAKSILGVLSIESTKNKSLILYASENEVQDYIKQISEVIV